MSYNQGQIQLPPFTRMNKIIISAYVGLFLINSILKATAQIDLSGVFSLSANGVLSGLVFQFFTYSFIGGGVLGVVFNSLILWFVGSELEQMWGEKRYAQFLATSVVGGGLIYFFISLLAPSLRSIPLLGMESACNATLVAYAILFPDRIFHFMMLFPIKAKYFCLLLVGISLYTGIFTPFGVNAWGHLGSMGFAFGFMLLLTKKLIRERSGDSLVGRKVRKSNAKLKLVKGDNVNDLNNDDSEPPKYWQ